EFDLRRLLPIVHDRDFVAEDLFQRDHLGVPVITHDDQLVAFFHKFEGQGVRPEDRKSTRLNSSHEWISYAVFCLKKKNNVMHSNPDHLAPYPAGAHSGAPPPPYHRPDATATYRLHAHMRAVIHQMPVTLIA